MARVKDLGFFRPTAEADQPSPAQELGQLPWAPEQEQWDTPITVTLPTGEEQQAFIKPDRTVWAGGKQIGWYDVATGQYTPMVPSVPAQFGRAALEMGAKGLEYLFKPFELFEEYVAKPAAMLASYPAWGKEAPEVTPGALTLEDIKAWFPGGEYAKAYEEWEEPVWFRLPSGYEVKPTKGLLELIPWFLFPAPIKLASWLGKAGKVGQIAAKGLAPYVAMEVALQKTISVPIKIGKKVVKTIRRPKKMAAPDLAPIEGVISDMQARHPERLRAGTHIEAMFKESNAVHLADLEVRDAATAGFMGTLGYVGRMKDLFKLKEVPIPGRTFSHELVTASYIVPKKEGASMAMADILSHLADYEWKGVKGQEAKAWAKLYLDILEGMKGFRKKYISKPVGELGMEHGEYVPRRVVAQIDVKTGKTIYEAPLTAGATRPGALAPSWKPRTYKTQMEGIESGHKYAPQDEVLEAFIEGHYNMASGERALAMLGDLAKKPTELINAGLKSKVKKLEDNLRFLKGGRTEYTEEGLKVIYRYPGIKAVVNRIRRGEVPSASTLRSIERRFPELGKKLREALNITMPELDRSIKSLSKAIWADIKTTPARFREVLQEVRMDRLGRAKVKPTAPAAPLVPGEAKVIKYKTSTGITLKTTEAEAKLQVINLREEEQLALRRLERLQAKQKAQPDFETYLPYIDESVPIDTMIEEQHAVLEMLQDEIMTITAALSAPVTAPVTRAAAKGVAEAVVSGKGKVTSLELRETLKRLGVEQNKSIKLLTALYGKAYKQPKAERNELLQSLLKDVNLETVAVQAELSVPKAAYQKGMYKATHTAISEGRIIDLPAFSNKIFIDVTDAEGRVIMSGREVAERILKIYGPEDVNAALRVASRAARAGVTVKAALDASWIFIQGSLVLGDDIARWSTGKKSTGWFSGTKAMLKTMFNPKYAGEINARKPGLAKHCAEIGVIMEREAEFIRAGDIERMVSKIPLMGKYLGTLVRQTYGRAGAGFSTGGKVARMTLVEQMEPSWVKSGHSVRELAEFLNKLTGVVSTRELGVSATRRALESAGAFSPRYTRSYLMVIRDLFRGNATAAEVRKAMAGMLAGGVIGYSTLCVALGQEPKLNPAPKALGGDGAEFMAFKIGDSIIGLPGFWYSTIRMMAAVSAAAQEDPERLLTLNWRENDFLRWVMGRASPLVRAADEIVEGKDYLGRNLEDPGDWMRHFSEYFLTIAAQNLVTRHPSEEEGKFKRFGAELFGLRAFPRSDWDKLRELKEEYSKKDFDKPYEELNLEQKDKLKADHPDYVQLTQDAKERMVLEKGEDYEQWIVSAGEQSDAIFYSGIEQAAQGLVSGQIDYKTYLDSQEFLRRVYKGRRWAINYIADLADPEAQAEFLKYLEEYQKPEDEALQRYSEIYGNPAMRGGVPDWDATEKRVNEFLASLGDETRAYVMRNKDRWIDKLPPLAQKLALIQSQGREIVDEYYAQPEGKERLAYRRANPTVEAWLLLMGRVSVPTTPMAKDIVLRLLRERGLPEAILLPAQARAEPQTPERQVVLNNFRRFKF